MSEPTLLHSSVSRNTCAHTDMWVRCANTTTPQPFPASMNKQSHRPGGFWEPPEGSTLWPALGPTPPPPLHEQARRWWSPCCKQGKAQATPAPPSPCVPAMAQMGGDLLRPFPPSIWLYLEALGNSGPRQFCVLTARLPIYRGKWEVSLLPTVLTGSCSQKARNCSGKHTVWH